MFAIAARMVEKNKKKTNTHNDQKIWIDPLKALIWKYM